MDNFIDIFFQSLRMVGASVGYMLKYPFFNPKRIAKFSNKMLDSMESVEFSFTTSFHGNLHDDQHSKMRNIDGEMNILELDK